LSGVSLGPVRSAHDVFVHVPGDHPWTWGGRHVLVQEHAAYSLRLVDSNVVRVRVRFEDDGRVPWKIDVAELLG
jgi:hypothetical protein